MPLGKLMLKVNHVEGLTYCLSNVVKNNVEIEPRDIQDHLWGLECLIRELKMRVIEVRKDLNKFV